MSWFEVHPFDVGAYVFVRLPFHKLLEVGYQRENGGEVPRSAVNLQFNTGGRDHAGLRFSAQLRRFFFELNLCDTRHWDHDAGCWHEPDARAD